MKKILCHVGPWSLDHYKYISNNICDSSELIILSGHPKCDSSGYFQRYLELVTKTPSFLDNIEIENDIDIITRCRLLRNLKADIALLHLKSAWVAIGEILDDQNPSLVLTETIDSFIMDILYFQSISRKIRFIGLVPTFISGYFRITARGEFLLSRDVTELECENVLKKLLNKNYRPDFIHNSDSKLIIYSIGRWLRNIIKIPFFFAKRLNSLERYNYHNWATLKVSLDWLHILPTLKLGHNEWKKELKESKKKVIYIPLQMIPEATVDYWCEDLPVVDYNNYLIKLIKNLETDFLFLVKEHPNVLGYRNPKLYKLLKKSKSVVFASTQSNSNELIDFSDAILIWTGSVGFEAAIRGKPVLTTSSPYYQTGSLFYKIDLSTSAEQIDKFIFASSNINLEKERYELVKHVLSGVLPSTYIIDGTWNNNNENHLKYAKNIAQQLKQYLNFIESH